MSDSFTSYLGQDIYGVDAFSNLYDVFIEFNYDGELARSLLNINQKVILRASDFQPPNLKLKTLELDYWANHFPILLPKVEGTKRLTLRFKVDDDWQIYNFFNSWKKMFFNVLTGNVSISPGKNYQNTADITILANKGSFNDHPPISLDNSTASIQQWKYYRCMCVDVSSPNFTRNSAQPIEISVDFIFYKHEEPSLFLNEELE